MNLLFFDEPAATTTTTEGGDREREHEGERPSR
jgi:hypothetical protein